MEERSRMRSNWYVWRGLGRYLLFGRFDEGIDGGRGRILNRYGNALFSKKEGHSSSH